MGEYFSQIVLELRNIVGGGGTPDKMHLFSDLRGRHAKTWLTGGLSIWDGAYYLAYMIFLTH